MRPFLTLPSHSSVTSCHRYPSGESYLDVIQRLEPVVIEVERQKDSVCIVGHQAILRVIVGEKGKLGEVGEKR